MKRREAIHRPKKTKGWKTKKKKDGVKGENQCPLGRKRKPSLLWWKVQLYQSQKAKKGAGGRGRMDNDAF